MLYYVLKWFFYVRAYMCLNTCFKTHPTYVEVLKASSRRSTVLQNE